MTNLEILSRIEKLSSDLGIPFFAVVKPKPVPLFEKYEKIIKEIELGDLIYLKKIEERKNPEKIFENIKSIIAFLFPYNFKKEKALNLKKYKVAQYSIGEDYHKKIKEKLKIIAKNLNGKYKIICDTSPFLEKPFGLKGGLGFMGKNTLLINKIFGSAFNLGFILTNIEIPEKILNFSGDCGSCKRCIEVCPTGAIEEPYFLNPLKCISYLTIEVKNIPEMPKERWGYIYGCDLCQAVCPYNENLADKGEEKKFSFERISKERLEENKKIVEEEKIDFYIKKEENFFPLNPNIKRNLKKILKVGKYYFNGKDFEGLEKNLNLKLKNFFFSLSIIGEGKAFEFMLK